VNYWVYDLLFRVPQRALKDIKKHKKAGNQATLKKIKKFLIELMEHPETGSGHQRY